MKTNHFVLIAAVLCSSCAWREYTDTPELRRAYLQTHSESQDSVIVNDGDNDSVYVPRAYTAGRNVVDSAAMAPDSVKCEIHVDGRLRVHGGTSTDISDTYVTVEKITVSIWADDREMKTYCPEINKEVAEPVEVWEWDTMPVGVNYARKRLTDAPVTVSYMDYFYVEVTVCYMLRVRDTKLAADCTADRYWNTVRYGSSFFRENRMDILVPLELTTIQFDAIVDSYE